MSQTKKIPHKPAAKANLISAETYERLKATAENAGAVFSEQDFFIEYRNGVKFVRMKRHDDPIKHAEGDPWRYRVWFGEDSQKVYVEEGSCVQDSGTIPVFPELDGVPLNERDSIGRPQGFGAGGLSSGTEYAVFVKVKNDVYTVELETYQDFLDDMKRENGQSRDCEAFRLIAKLTLGSGASGKTLSSIEQVWGSDIDVPAYYCDDKSDDGSDNASDAGGSDSDSTGGSDDMPSGGSDDSDDDPNNGGHDTSCCNKVTINAFEMRPNCLTGYSSAQDVTVTFSASAILFDPTDVFGGTCECSSIIIEGTINGWPAGTHPIVLALHPSGQTTDYFFTAKMKLFPCQRVILKVVIRSFGQSISQPWCNNKTFCSATKCIRIKDCVDACSSSC